MSVPTTNYYDQDNFVVNKQSIARKETLDNVVPAK